MAAKKRDRRNPHGFEVYRHTCDINGKYYIGITEYSAKRRWVQHCRAANLGSHLFIHKAIRKYGATSFSHEVLEIVKTREDANAAETKWVAFYKADQADFGYNLDAGGRSHNTHSESRAKISAARKALFASMSEQERSAYMAPAQNGLTKAERRALTLQQWAECSDEEKAVQVARLKASRTTEERSAETKRLRATESAEKKAERERKRRESLTFEKRSAAAIKRNATLGVDGLKAVGAKISAVALSKTPEERAAIAAKVQAAITPEVKATAAAKRVAQITPEKRLAMSVRWKALFTPQQLSEMAFKREQAKRDKKAAEVVARQLTLALA